MLGSKFRYRTKYRTYDLLAVGSVMFGRIIHPKGTKRVLNLVSFLTGDEVELIDLPKAIRFCGERLINGQAWRNNNAREDFLDLGILLDALDAAANDLAKLKEAKLKTMLAWRAKEEKKRSKSFSLSPLDGNRQKEWLRFKTLK